MTPSKPVRREPLARKSRLRPVGTPVRLQRSRAKGARLVSPNGLPVVCVTRPGKWGNPFKVGQPNPLEVGWRDGKLAHLPIQTKAAAMHLYARCVSRFPVGQVELAAWRDAGGNTAMLVALAGRVESILGQLRGKNLACWCKPGEPCHADVLLEIANAPERAGGAS